MEGKRFLISVKQVCGVCHRGEDTLLACQECYDSRQRELEQQLSEARREIQRLRERENGDEYCRTGPRDTSNWRKPYWAKRGKGGHHQHQQNQPPRRHERYEHEAAGRAYSIVELPGTNQPTTSTNVANIENMPSTSNGQYGSVVDLLGLNTHPTPPPPSNDMQ